MLRNGEIRRLCAIFCTSALLFVTAGFLIHWTAGSLVLVSAVFFGALFWNFTRARYRKLAEISEQIDLVLHYGERMEIVAEEEGELSILRSEIIKMTGRIREQNDMLKREKKNLADSLADIAHQLRTPLTSANLILSLLENDPEPKEQKRLLREAEELFAQMDFLLNSLLKLSRLDAGVVPFKRERIDVSRLLETAIHPLSIALELHDITLLKKVPPGAEITGDISWLSEAVRNILKNCMESAGDGGTIEISCTDTPLYTEIAIRDSGAGFEKEELRHIFDRFYRGKKESAVGYGIGLSLARTVILRSDGTLSAKNHPEGGALFTIQFPKE